MKEYKLFGVSLIYCVTDDEDGDIEFKEAHIVAETEDEANAKAVKWAKKYIKDNNITTKYFIGNAFEDGRIGELIV